MPELDGWVQWVTDSFGSWEWPPMLRSTSQEEYTLEEVMSTQQLQQERLEFFDLDPGNTSPRTLLLQPAAVPGYYLAFLDGQLIRGEWEITDSHIEGDAVFLRLINRRPRRKSPHNAQLEVIAAEGVRLLVSLCSDAQSMEDGSWHPDFQLLTGGLGEG